MKVGTKVNVRRRTGEIAMGVVHAEPLVTGRGSFIPVNLGDKKTPLVRNYRPGVISKR